MTRRVRNFDQRFYRAKQTAQYEEGELAAWPPEKLQAFYGLIIQNSSAEAIAALHAGSISGEPRSWLTWARLNEDPAGWDALLKVFAWTWRQLQEIETESIARAERDGTPLRTVTANLQGYPRGRNARSSIPRR